MDLIPEHNREKGLLVNGPPVGVGSHWEDCQRRRCFRDSASRGRRARFSRSSNPHLSTPVQCWSTFMSEDEGILATQTGIGTGIGTGTNSVQVSLLPHPDIHQLVLHYISSLNNSLRQVTCCLMRRQPSCTCTCLIRICYALG